ncbi:MAG TPA: hypothetical protein PKA49_10935, partial [Tepidiformaceae bacterium]|nr:hypothetical protein [Tepidiformaceae bacterium]
MNEYDPGAPNVNENDPVSDTFDENPLPATLWASPVLQLQVTVPPAPMVTTDGFQRCAAVALTRALEGAPAGVAVGGTGVGGAAVGGTGVGCTTAGVAVGGTACVGGANDRLTCGDDGDC